MPSNGQEEMPRLLMDYERPYQYFNHRNSTIDDNKLQTRTLMANKLQTWHSVTFSDKLLDNCFIVREIQQEKFSLHFFSYQRSTQLILYITHAINNSSLCTKQVPPTFQVLFVPVSVKHLSNIQISPDEGQILFKISER